MICVIDYGLGNVGSILNMLKKIGVPRCLSRERDEIANADKLILPGVGAFDVGMEQLHNLKLDDMLTQLVTIKKKPLLGICLGMQLLGLSSEEGTKAGLGFIRFKNLRFNIPAEMGLKIPHIGWDYITITDCEAPLVEGITKPQRFYFTHSYHAVCENEDNVLMWCNYGYPFAAAVRSNNIWGTQFHPEKSHHYGLKLLENFARYC